MVAAKKAKKRSAPMAAKKSEKGAAGPAEVKSVIEVMPMESKVLTVRIVGDGHSRLVVNRFPEKGKRMMEQKQAGKKVPREIRDPESDYAHSFYYLPTGKDGKPLAVPEYKLDKAGKPGEEYEAFVKGLPSDPNVRYGFPVTGLKSAMASAAQRVFGAYKTVINGALFLHGEPSMPDGVSPMDCFEIVAERIEKKARVRDDLGVDMRTDMVRLAGPSRPADLRYRGEFVNWYSDVEIEYRPQMITAETIVNLLQWAGATVGIGEWRVEKGGEWGRFVLATQAVSAGQPVAFVGPAPAPSRKSA